MEFRRIPGLPPYVFTIIDGLKVEARRNGRDVIDLGFGNPDIPSPEIAVEKLAEAARNTRNHRYSASRGIPKLREAVADLYQRRFGVTLDPETQVISTIGAKEGFSHLMWVLLQPGDAALVPSPSYPIHIWGPYFAGADSRQVPVGDGEDFIENVMEAWELGWPKPRVVVLSFPHNPTTATVEKADLQRLVDWARERDVVLVHDFAYAETAFDGWKPPSILECEGANECAVELYSMTKSFSMAGWRVAFLVGNPEVVRALASSRATSTTAPSSPSRSPPPSRSTRPRTSPTQTNAIYQSRRDTLLDGLARIGWEFPKPKGHDVRLGADPRALPGAGVHRLRQADHHRLRRGLSPASASAPAATATSASPSSRTSSASRQAVRNLKKGLTKLG